MKPFKHAKGSVARWGGRREDYQPIHDFIDSSKMAMPDMRHRAALHNAFGCFVVERVFVVPAVLLRAARPEAAQTRHGP